MEWKSYFIFEQSQFTLKFANGISHFLQQSYSRLRYAHPENYCQHPRIWIKWIKSLTLAEIGHFKSQQYKNLFSQARSSRFLYVGYSWISILNNSTKECNFEM